MTTYRVANPRGIPAGRHVLAVSHRVCEHDHAAEPESKTAECYEHAYFHEGDAIAPGDAFSEKGWKAWRAGGFVLTEKEWSASHGEEDVGG